MRRVLLSITSVLLVFCGFCQSEDAMILHENARKFMQQGDYANATIILVRASEQAPFALAIAKDLALCYYMQNDNSKALNTLRPFIDKDNADEQSYQISGMVYKRMNQPKEADKMYKKALRLFPKSGPLYNDYGDLLWAMKDYSAINQWEKGIKEDPAFSGNYFNATRYYFLSQDKIWSLIYGEIFINLESHSPRTAEIKNILLDSYKKLFSTPNLLSDLKGKNPFETAFLTGMNKQNDIVIRGLNVETLTMVRTRFILYWYKREADKFPFKLFDYQKKLLENGLFQAYNQWIFGAGQNPAAFQNWANTHREEYEAFNKYLQDSPSVFSGIQYYH